LKRGPNRRRSVLRIVGQGTTKPFNVGHPQFEGFEVYQTVEGGKAEVT
jgi:hypothetical protein